MSAAKLTMNLWPETGQALGLSRNATFAAARNGDIPTIRIGRRLLVPKVALQKMLEGAGQKPGTGEAA